MHAQCTSALSSGFPISRIHGHTVKRLFSGQHSPSCSLEFLSPFCSEPLHTFGTFHILFITILSCRPLAWYLMASTSNVVHRFMYGTISFVSHRSLHHPMTTMTGSNHIRILFRHLFRGGKFPQTSETPSPNFTLRGPYMMAF